ncbi:MAG: DnaB-like helicase C-terminal domain-containing protein, partial [Desulfobacterales bacterium]
YYSMQDVAENIASEEVFERMKNTEFKTGFIDLDLNFHIHHEDLIIIAGRPSMGKTAFALGLAKNFALLQGEPVAFFSYEMSKEQLAVRLANSESAGDKSFEGFSRAVNKIRGMPLYMVDKPVSLMDARGIMRELSRKGVKHFFFDYLQIMPASHGENRTQELSHLTRTLKLYAKEFGCVNWVLSQLSRAVEARQDKRPSLADLRESGAIEQDADTVLFLYRPVYYGINSTDDIDNTNNLAQVLIRKQRNFKSPVDVNLFYRPETNYWENWGSPAKYPSLADLTEITEDESIPF